MTKKILLDLIKCRSCKECNTGCKYLYHPNNNGMKAIREMAAFSFTCRHCEDAPCIAVCPVEALSKDSGGMISRSVHLCVACKSCVTVCPFGSLMNDFFDTRKSICDYCNFKEETKSLLCIDTCCEKAISFYDGEQDEKENIYALNDRVLVKEYAWENLKYDD